MHASHVITQKLAAGLNRWENWQQNLEGSQSLGGWASECRASNSALVSVNG